MDICFRELTKLISTHDKVILMTHTNPDLDGMGSALVLERIVSRLGKPCYIVSPKKNNDKCLNKAFNLLIGAKFPFSFIDEDKVDFNALLIILDTQKPELVSSIDVLNTIKDKVVIDHHIRGNSYIDDALCYVCDEKKSSVVEIITDYLKFLNFGVEPILATILLAGMEVDTNSFNFKTTGRTFEAAAFLVDHGADLIVKQEILKESKSHILKKYDYIKESFKISKNIIVCRTDSKIHENVELALLAKELLKIENIQASFVIGKLSSDTIGVSARSLGNINVGEIMEKMGGGGHATDAAAQINDKSADDVFCTLKQIIKEGKYEGYTTL